MGMYIGKKKVAPVIKFKEKPKGEFYVKVFDYDGTLLDEVWLNNGESYIVPTAPPEKERLLFQEWSCTQEIIDGKVTIDNNDVMIGAIYTTKTGLCEFDYSVTKYTGKSIILNMDGTKDWGDGTSDDLTTHEYADYGEYTIICNGTTLGQYISGQSGASTHALKRARLANLNANSLSADFIFTATGLETITIPQALERRTMGDYMFYNTDSLKCLIFPTNSQADDYVSRQQNSLETALYPYGTTSLYGQTLQNVPNLKNFVVPKSINRIDRDSLYSLKAIERLILPVGIGTLDSICYNGYALEKLVIPYGVKTITGGFTDCYKLTSLDLPDSVTTVGSGFSNFFSLKEVVFPNSITTFSAGIFASAYTLKRVKMPNNLTSFAGGFSNCCSLEIIDFSGSLQVPSLTRTSFLNYAINPKIIVPDALYNEWVVATNWSFWENYIYKASEVNLND